MKYSVVALSAFAAAAQAAQPSFTNSNFDVRPNEPFTITYDGCATSACTIKLKSGPSGNLIDAAVLTSSATGSSFTVTPSPSWPAGDLAFEISNAEGTNYSKQFPYAGTGTGAVSSAGTSSASPMAQASSTPALPSAKTSTSVGAATTTATDSTAISTGNTSTSSTSMSTAGRNTTRTLSSSRPTDTIVPTAGVDRVSASLALVAGVAAAMACLN